MIEHRKFHTKLTVRFTKRDDGGLRAYCDGVPGFYLSGIDKRAVMRDVIPALKALVQANFDMSVDVSPLGYGIYQLREDSPAEEDLPDIAEYTRDYLVERVAA
jgi:hypothetical protein